MFESDDLEPIKVVLREAYDDIRVGFKEALECERACSDETWSTQSDRLIERLDDAFFITYRSADQSALHKLPERHVAALEMALGELDGEHVSFAENEGPRGGVLRLCASMGLRGSELTPPTRLDT